MKQVKVISWCDGDHEEKEIATIERIVSIDQGKPVLLDLCEPHDKAFVDLLALMENGAVVEPGKKKKGSSGKTGNRPAGAPFETTIPFEGPHICPECGFESKSRGALGQHLSTKHNKGFKDYRVNPEPAEV